MIIYAVLFALLLRYVNGITTFWEGALTAYALWLVVDWYDFLVIDVLCAPFGAVELVQPTSHKIKVHASVLVYDD